MTKRYEFWLIVSAFLTANVIVAILELAWDLIVH